MRQSAVLAAVFLMSMAGASEAASTWYGKADAAAGGDGSRGRPFVTLEQVEAASQPGDTIRVLPSMRPLDGGIQLVHRSRANAQPTSRSAATSCSPRRRT